MKGLATLLIAILLLSVAATAGPLEMSFGGGPSAISLGNINASIGVFNTLITHLNETFDIHPDVSGFVEPIDPMVSGLSFHAGERLWLMDWFGLGAAAEYFTSSSATAGQYEGDEVSTIDVSFGMTTFSVTLGGRATFLDAGLRLAAEGAVGYYYVAWDHAVIFEVPSEYPDTISGIPPEGEKRFTGSTFGFEVGLSLSYPIARWFSIGSTVSYRAATVGSVTDQEGSELDLDGDGMPEPVDLDGITVRLTLSINFDLSPYGEKE
ncbi:MAG: hypothetical protein WBC63_05210 [Candidatus Bipolaricaulia bacterium]